MKMYYGSEIVIDKHVVEFKKKLDALVIMIQNEGYRAEVQYAANDLTYSALVLKYREE